MRGKTVLELTYKPYFREEKKHVVHPYLLKEFRNRWFLIGRTGTHRSPTTFALDSINRLRAVKQKFLENDLFDPSTYYDHIVGVTMIEGAMPIDVKLKLAADRVPYVITKPLHSSQTIVRQFKDGSAELRLQVVDNFELRAMLLGFGPSVEVVSPISIRSAWRDMHKEAARVNA
jgi:predicted DNA-binding transcriptional regulator YafY